ncbi:hypothetical protein [Nitrosococcus wardiae]|uniref:Uncharacterized protein n=1 Tax=Nitrosococcus wardiae TaxID=1814290 RepID=A0A4P7C5C7_9GAMM|nr:hypothetical protein [Nitrosococcus wardiae]QBQ56206.1 hypothetical protein E3U44_18145 [Nitrosococcus wardiae]
MRKPWRNIIGWTVLSAVAIAASQEVLYKTVARVGERMGEHAIENARRIQSQAQQALVRPHKI